MGLLGDLIAFPIKLVNAPIKAVENLMAGGEPVNDDDRILSAPLKALSDELEKVDD